MTGSEAITDRSSAILQRIAWAMDIPMPQVLEMTVEDLIKRWTGKRSVRPARTRQDAWIVPLTGSMNPARS